MNHAHLDPAGLDDAGHGHDLFTAAAVQTPQRANKPDPWRLAAVATVLFAAFAFVAVQLVVNAVPGTVGPAVANINVKSAREVSPRASIIDRRGELIAHSLKFQSLFANPKEVRDPAAVARALKTVLPTMNVAEVERELSNKAREFAYIDRHLPPNQHAAVLELGIPGLYFVPEYKRVYPRGRLAAHLVGTVQHDHRGGINGAESFFDADLVSNADLPLELSVDLRVQNVVAEEVAAAMKKFNAISGLGLVMDVNTGEVLASVSLPDFDPNRLSSLDSDTQLNQVVGGRYELGSMFKLITSAIAIETGMANETTRFDATRPLRVHGHRIADYRGENRWLSMREVLIHSSNIGAAKMAELISAPVMKRYYGSFGLLAKSQIELKESSNPITPQRWQDIQAMTASFGHGISVTPIQFAAAIGALANGGVLHRPTIVKVVPGAEPVGTRVIGEATSKRMLKLMRGVVVEGSGKGANSAHYRVGGKTGTALKAIKGGYSKDKRRSSFVGVLPVEDPKYLVMVSIDEPKGNKESYGFATGGWVAAPAVGEIVDRVAPMLGLQKSAPDLDALSGVQAAAVRTRH